VSDYEGIQQTIAFNNIALDDRRFEDCIATYTPDGTIAGHTGHDAIRAFILSQDLAVRDVRPLRGPVSTRMCTTSRVPRWLRTSTACAGPDSAMWQCRGVHS
jgi:hypothetical protein